MAKKIKISGVKRSQHIKHKKNFGRQQKKNVKPKTIEKKPTSSSKNVFGKPSNVKQKRREKNNNSSNVKQPKKHESGQTNGNDEQIENDENGFDADDMREMLDDDDVLSYQGKRKHQDQSETDDTSALESKYTKKRDEERASNKTRTVDLLPIKTKKGEIITRSTEIDIEMNKIEIDDADSDEDGEDDGEEEEIDSDDEIINETSSNLTILANGDGKSISTADLLILREQELNRQKYRVGIICSSILEKPDDKMKNFSLLFDLITERNKNGEPNLFSIRKMAILSILEVFKDIIPEYRIGQIDLKSQQVKKTTMERVSFEDSLLMYYKKYLQRLEKFTSATSKGQRKLSRENAHLAEVATKCLSELLTTHPYFNFSQNIAQLLVYLLNSNNTIIRTNVHTTFKQIFTEDKKFELTLFIVRRLNHLIKSKSNLVHVEMLTCMLSLQIKSINLNDEKDAEIKQKKMEQHKARLINMSKKEKKRMKKLKQLDKELLESKAEENKETKHKKLTEISKMVFSIYFRILKNDPNSQLLSATLEGLAEFAHVINLDFFADLIEVLNQIMQIDDLGYREQLHCIQTFFIILSGQGEVLNIDPLRFYGHLYRCLFIIHAGKNYPDFNIILRSVCDVLIKRRKAISLNRLYAFLKRITILSLQLQHNGTLACLGVLKSIMQLTSNVEKMLDTDTTTGSGQYDPYLDDPEYCNANAAALYEMTALTRHYHSIVRKVSTYIVSGASTTGAYTLPLDIGKLQPIDLFKQYDSSEMAFNPPIPPPKPVNEEKFLKEKRHIFTDKNFELICKSSLNVDVIETESSILDFYSAFK